MSITGQPIFLLKPADLETRLRLNYPELASAKVIDLLPNVVSVDVVERKPVIRWEQGRRLHLDLRGWRGIPAARRDRRA